MKNKSKIITGIIIVGILLVAVILFLIGGKKTVLAPVEVIDKTMSPVGDKDQILGNKDDLISFSIWPNTKVHGVVSFRGIIKEGYFFEENILINVLDLNKKVLKVSNAIAKSDWMTAEPVNFEGSIDFTGLPKGPAYFEIHNNNISGLPEHDKSILIPIIIE